MVKFDEVYLLKPEIFEKFDSLLAILATRKSVNSDRTFNFGFTKNNDPEEVKNNRRILLEQLGISETQLAIPKQIHSSNICFVEKPGIYDECDALVTDKKEIFLVVSVADCSPVYIYDPKKKIISLVHCGWRGASEKIVEKTVAFIRDKFKSEPRDLIVHIGACASVCCYEVDKEFDKIFDVRFLRFKRNGKYHFDLKGEIYAQLVKSGVKFENISVSPYCTICGGDIFHSYRRDGENSGRMWALFGMR